MSDTMHNTDNDAISMRVGAYTLDAVGTTWGKCLLLARLAETIGLSLEGQRQRLQRAGVPWVHKAPVGHGLEALVIEANHLDDFLAGIKAPTAAVAVAEMRAALASQPTDKARPARTALARVGVKTAATVEFKGLFTVRLLLGEDGRKRVAPKDLADAMGIDADGVRQRLMRSVMRKGTCMMQVPSDGGVQDTLTIDIHYLPGLLLGIDVSRVREAIRPRLTEIQEELYDALANYTFNGVAVNPAVTNPAAVPALSAEGMALALAQVIGPILTETVAPVVRQLAEMESRSMERHAALVERVLGLEAHRGPGDPVAVGTVGAREICRALRAYGEAMAPVGDKQSAKSWRSGRRWSFAAGSTTTARAGRGTACLSTSWPTRGPRSRRCAAELGRRPTIGRPGSR